MKYLTLNEDKSRANYKWCSVKVSYKTFKQSKWLCVWFINVRYWYWYSVVTWCKYVVRNSFSLSTVRSTADHQLVKYSSHIIEKKKWVHCNLLLTLDDKRHGFQSPIITILCFLLRYHFRSSDNFLQVIQYLVWMFQRVWIWSEGGLKVNCRYGREKPVVRWASILFQRQDKQKILTYVGHDLYLMKRKKI